MFIHQHSILYRQKDKNRLFESSGNSHQRQNAETRLYRASSRAPSTAGGRAGSVDLTEEMADGSSARTAQSPSHSVTARRSHLLSFSSVDDASFVSARDTIADLKDFEDFDLNGRLHQRAYKI